MATQNAKLFGSDEDRVGRAIASAFRGGGQANAGTSSMFEKIKGGAKRFAGELLDPGKGARDQELLQAQGDMQKTAAETGKLNEEERKLQLANDELDTKFDSNAFFNDIDPTGKLGGQTQAIMDQAVGGLDGVATKKEVRDSYENGSFPAKKLEEAMSVQVKNLGEQYASGKTTLEIAASEKGITLDDLRNNEAVGMTFQNSALMKELHKLDAFENKVKMLTKKRDQMTHIGNEMERQKTMQQRNSEVKRSPAYKEDIDRAHMLISSGKNEDHIIAFYASKYPEMAADIKAVLRTGRKITDYDFGE
jgi:hypothetical protein